MSRIAVLLGLLAAGCAGEVTGATSPAIDGPPGAVLDARPLVAVDAGPSAAIHFVGRFETSDPGGPRFAWPGSAILTRFDGTGIDVDLPDPGDNRFAVVIDGGDPTVIATGPGQTRHTLASGLPDGPHDLGLYRRTESYQGVTQFGGLFPHGGKPLVATPPPPARHIEIIGDSMSCGYGNEGANELCHFSADTENEYLTYGAIAARTLGATHTDICYSGKGAYRNYGGSTTDPMPAIYDRVFADRASPLWDLGALVPDVIVVNLGTNDFSVGDPGQPYVSAMLAFARRLRGLYPRARILLAVGSMLGGANFDKAAEYVQGVVSTMGDAGVSYVEFPTQSSMDGLGCDYHPNLVTHRNMADRLVASIRAVTGW
jgi:lysophospholipase L1-like esterase